MGLTVRAAAVAALLCAACGASETADRSSTTTGASGESFLLTLVGTNDLHGRIERLPWLAGHVSVLRQLRRADGGAVLLIDGGDMFQGTLESNLTEGASVVRGYNTLRYDASTVGNHEFDFGPVGDAAAPQSPDDDPRGALRARATEASFPILTANVLMRTSGRRVEWDNMPATTMLEVRGIKVGVIGVTTEDTLTSTLAANVADLALAPLAPTIEHHAAALREAGAAVVIVSAHAGGVCHDHTDPEELASCDADQEIFRVARALPIGLVDVIVAGHTHKGVAQRVNGIAIIESFAYGVAFGRVDLRLHRATGRVQGVTIHPPRTLCSEGRGEGGPCTPEPYEGRTVAADRRVAQRLAADMDRADAIRRRALGVRIETTLTSVRNRETALGNLLADLIREARSADVGLMNGGGVRNPLPAGELNYGQFYRTFPFDNRFALVRMTGADFASLLVRNLTHDAGIFLISGLTARATCTGGRLRVELRRGDGSAVGAREQLTVSTSDFVATGSEPVFVRARAEGRVRVEDGPPMRDALVRLLEARGGTLRAQDLHDPARPRLGYEGTRPLGCE